VLRTGYLAPLGSGEKGMAQDLNLAEPSDIDSEL
jgi:hypothetical protein